MNLKNQKNEGSLSSQGSFKSRITAAVLLFSLTVNIGAQSIPDSVRGFDRGVYDYHFSAADREMTPEKWLESARRGLSLARSSWERMAGDLLCDPAEMADSRALLDEWSEDELERRYAQWIETRFLRREISESVFNFTNNAENEFLGFYYHLDENGNITFEEESGDPSVIRPDERNVNADREHIANRLASETDSSVQDYEQRLEYLFPELLAYIDESRRGSLQEAFTGIAHTTSTALRLELESLALREDNLFVSRRIADSYSLRNKSESEAARIIAGDLISAAEDVCNQGIAALEEQIEAARTGTGNLALLGQDWLAQYEEQFHRGLKAWEDAEERFFVRRIEWEQEAGRQWTEGEAVWAEAFNRLAVEQQRWEAKAKELFDSGEQLFRDASDDLQRSISAARAEFQRDAEIRAESGKTRAEAYVTSYLTSGSIVAAAQENVDFWMDFFWEETAVRLGTNIESAKAQFGLTGGAPQLSISDEFSPWFDNLRTQEISVLEEYIESLETENEELQEQIETWQRSITLKRSQLSGTNTNSFGRWSILSEINRLQAQITNAQNNIRINEQKINQYRQDIARTDTNAESEIKRWTEIYGSYYVKAVEARNALVNDFNVVMGNGALADILEAGVSSEDFNLDEYQVELIRAQAVAGYWNRRVEVAEAVNAYAEDLTANRITDAEGVAAWQDAKAAYDDALSEYAAAQQALELEAANVSSARDALNAARAALEAADNALNELNAQYSLYASLLVMDDCAYLLEDIAAKYTELMTSSNLLKETGENALYKNYIEKAYALGAAQLLESQGLALKTMINGNVSSPALAELNRIYNAIFLPPQALEDAQQTVFFDIAEYGIEPGDMYYNLIQQFMAERDAELAAHDELYREMEPAYNEAVAEHVRLTALQQNILDAEQTENAGESGDGTEQEDAGTAPNVTSGAENVPGTGNVPVTTSIPDTENAPDTGDTLLDGTTSTGDEESEQGVPPQMTLEEINVLLAEYQVIIDAYEAMPGTRRELENQYNKEIYKAASAAKKLAEISLVSRRAAIGLLTAESTGAWFTAQYEYQTEGKTEQQIADEKNADIADIESDGLEYFLNRKVSTAETRLNEFLNSPERAGMEKPLKLFYAGDILFEYEKLNGLYLAYFYAKSGSAALAKEESNLAAAEINNIFAAQGLVFITPEDTASNTPEHMAMPDVTSIANNFFTAVSGDAIIANTANFLNELDEQFRRLPQEIYAEYTSWVNAFVDYTAAKFIYENESTSVTLESLYQSIVQEQEYQRIQALLAQSGTLTEEAAADTQAESAPHGDSYIGILNIQYRLLFAIERQNEAAQAAATAAAATEASVAAGGSSETPPPLDQKEHWREIISPGILGEYNTGREDNEMLTLGDIGAPESMEGIAAAASYAEGALADMAETAWYASNLFNDVLEKLDTSAYWIIDDRIKQSALQYQNDNDALWDDSHIIYTEYSYKDSYNTEKNVLNNKLLKMDMLRNEILRLGNGYLFAKNAKSLIGAEMDNIGAEMDAMKLDRPVLDASGQPTGEIRKGINRLMTEYGAAADGFAAAGSVYDAKYSEAKVLYEAMEAAAFAYEKQDAIRRWASTSYLQESETSGEEIDGLTPQYNNPADELAYCLERQERAGIVLTALTNLYDANAEARPFNDAAHNQIYAEYRQSFQRMMETMKIRDTLLAAIQKETRNNEKLHDEYLSKYSAMTNNRIDTSEISVSSADRTQWTLTDIITTDSAGRLVFNRGTGFSLQGQTAQSAAGLTAYFNDEQKRQPEAHKTTDFEQGIRALNERMAGYITSVDKYKQWGMARDYLIRKLQNSDGLLNGEGRVLNGLYAMANDLHDGNLSNMKVSYTNTQVDDIAYSSSELMAVQEMMWNTLSAEEKKDLEFYTILCMMGGGVVNDQFASNASMLAEYEDAYDWVSSSYNSTYKNGIIITCISPFIVNPLTLVIGIMMLASLGDIGFTRNELSKKKSNWQGLINSGYTSLSANITGMHDNFDKYYTSSVRLSALVGEAAENQSAGWAEISLSLRTAEISESDISKMQTLWEEMNSGGSVTRYASAQEAVMALAQWTKNKRQDAKSAMERSWTDNDAERTEAQAVYRSGSEAYIEGGGGLAGVLAAAEAAYGEEAAARKTYFGQLGQSLIDNMEGVTEDGSAYGGEYAELAGELTALIERLYGTRYQAELQAREAEWSVRQADLTKKYNEWRNTAALILARGREDWSKGAERMRERYAQWQKQFSDEYGRVYAGWETAYLAGLKEKETWIAGATAAAMDASGGAMLEMLGIDEASADRAFGSGGLLSMDVPDAAGMSETTLAEIFAGAGIMNLESAFGTISNAAKTVNTKVRTGLGGNGVWNAGTVQKEARELVKAVNAELAERESKRLAATTRKRAEAMIAGIGEQIAGANKNTDEQIDKTFIYDGRWQRKGKNYVKDVLIDSTVIEGPVTERASVEVYKYYVHDDEFTMPSYLDESELEKLESFGINALIGRLNKEVEKFFEDIFGKHDETKKSEEQDKGKFGKHVGDSASPRSDMKPDMSKNEMFSGNGNRGTGEMGRLFQDYIYWNIREGTGVSSMNAAVWEKSLWHKKPGDWFDPPSIKSIASIALQVAGTLAGGPIAGALVGLIDDALFAMLDVAAGYKDPLEAGFELGKQVLMTAATTGLGLAYSGISAGIGGGISGVVGKTLVGAHQTITTGVVTSAIGAVNYSSEGGLSFSTESFTSGVTSSLKGALTGAVGTFTGGMIDLKADGFVGSVFKDTKNFSNTIGGLAGQAVGFAMGDDFKFNLLNLSSLTGGKASGGLLELSIGRNGVSAAIGSGGLDMSIGTIASAINGISTMTKVNSEMKKSGQDEATKYAVALRSLYSGGATEKTEYEAILAGKTNIREDAKLDAVAKSDYDAETGIKTITLGAKSLDSGGRYDTSVVLAHEAYRNGKDDGEEGQVKETNSAVTGHINMSLALMSAYGAGAVNGSYGTEAKNYVQAVTTNNYKALNDIFDSYDSSADYWKLMKDGSLQYDGSGWLVDENGKPILNKEGKPIGAGPIETGLLNILNGGTSGVVYSKFKDEQVEKVQGLMTFAGLVHTEGGIRDVKWNEGNNNKVINFSQIINGGYGGTVASAVFASGYDKLSDTAIFSNTRDDRVNIFNSVHTDSKDRFGELVASKTEFYTGTYSLVGGGTRLVGEYGKEITDATGKKAADFEKYYKSYNFKHFGIDLAPEDKNTKNLPNIYTGISGTVRASSVNATNGNYVEIEYGYAFEGAIINTGIYGRYLHLQNAPEVKAGQYVSSSTKLGVMGTTGKSTGVHLHYDISTVPKTNYSDTAMKVFLGNNYAQGSMMNNQEPGVETIATRTVYDPTAFAEQNKQKYKKPRIYW